jgi:hypothetical protein
VGAAFRLQLAEAEKEQKRQAFEQALATPDEAPMSDTIVLEDMHVEDSYSGPRMEGAPAAPSSTMLCCAAWAVPGCACLCRLPCQ